MSRLKGKRIIVVGAGSGIGAATVRRLAGEGARVCVADINTEGANTVAQQVCDSGGEAYPVAIDLADKRTVDEAVALSVERLGGLDGAHINAADLRVIMEDSDAETVSLDIFDRTIDVNLKGHLLCTRAVLPHLLANDSSAIVYTSSSAADAGEPVRPSYAMSKSGLNALMRHVASCYGAKGITANSVAPGFVLTEEMESSGHLTDDIKNYMLSRIPGTRLGSPDDIAGMVAMLLSEDGRWINGQVFNVNGGALMR
tara:strand:+ start:4014 stop:4781 length:768 start_codon:yes stop_codon:yes gene_type:complete